MIVGTRPVGDWLPQVALSEAEASALDGAIASLALALEPVHPDSARSLLSRLAMSCLLEAMPLGGSRPAHQKRTFVNLKLGSYLCIVSMDLKAIWECR